MTDDEEMMLDELLDADEGLSGSEVDFIDDLDRRWRERELSEKQQDWLKRIWDRVVG